MLLEVAGALTALGFAVWIVGMLLGYQGVAVLGGVLVLGVGAQVTVDPAGLEVRAGETVEKNYETVGNETVVANTTSTVTTESVPLPTRLPLGVLLMLLGGTGVLRGLDPEDGGFL